MADSNLNGDVDALQENTTFTPKQAHHASTMKPATGSEHSADFTESTGSKKPLLSVVEVPAANTNNQMEIGSTAVSTSTKGVAFQGPLYDEADDKGRHEFNFDNSPTLRQRTRSDEYVVDDLHDEESTRSPSDVDIFGMPAYQQQYPDGMSSDVGGALSVPWTVRTVRQRHHCTFFDFLRVPQFWWQVEFAARITGIAVLVPAALIAAKLPNTPFVSASMPMSASVLAAKQSVGEAIAYLCTWARAGCFWLPLAAIGGAMHLGQHMAGWCVYYTAILVVMATFTENMVRRICLLLFNISLVGLLVDKNRGALYPCRVMGDWCIGTGLCLLASFLPYPVFCHRHAQKLLESIARNTGTAFRGLVFSFWSPTNVERNMAMSKVRTMTASLDDLLPAFEHSQAFSFYEFMFESTEAREIRDVKYRLFEHLRVNLSSMTRVLDVVEASPGAIDNSDRCKAFSVILTPHLDCVAESFDELMTLLAKAKTKREVLNLHDLIERLKDRTDDLQDAYVVARRMLFYEHTSAILEEFVPLMTFYLFTVVCFRDTIEIFDVKVKKFTATMYGTLREFVKKVAIDPFMDNVHFLRKLFKYGHRHEIQPVIEAAKVSGAMILTIGFSYLIKVEMNSFSGPNIIAFVSGSNPVEAVQASIVRLTGCLVGTVLGFFAGTYSETLVQRVASLCTLMFCGTFLRNDVEYGVMAVYAMFVLIPLDSIIPTTMDDTVARMNQNTFGIFIYLFVSALVFPLSPSLILRRKRINVLKRMSNFMTKMMSLLSTPLVTDAGAVPFHPDEPLLFHSGAFNSSGAGGNQNESNDESLLGTSNCDSAMPPTTRGKQLVSNRSIHIVLGKDIPMEELSTLIADITTRLKGTKTFMGFAKDERSLVEVDYPVKACNETYLHMYHMTTLLKTMIMSWNVIRSQSRFTLETKHMMRTLQPIATDVARSFRRFVDLMTYVMNEPATNLEADIMKAVLDLNVASAEFHKRKSQIMLMLINSSVAKYRYLHQSQPHHPSSGDSGKATACAPSLRSKEDDKLHVQRAGCPYNRATAGRPPIRHMSEDDMGSEVHLEDVHGDNLGGVHTSRVRSGSPRGSPRLSRVGTFDGLNTLYSGKRTTPTTGEHGKFRSDQSERNVSILPFLRNRASEQGEDESYECPRQPVRLPADFLFPVSSEDAEGFHSLTLCLEMFSNETKLMMMSLSRMLDVIRSKR